MIVASAGIMIAALKLLRSACIPRWRVSGDKEESECSAAPAPKATVMPGTSVDDQIERSKRHWSQLVELDSDAEEVAEIRNVEVFKALQMHSEWGSFFLNFDEGEGRSLVVG